MTDALWAARSSSLFDNRIRFAGYQRDTETGLYHVRHRMYHPTLGRWLQRDPEGYVDGMNVYEYVRAGVAVASDPTGLKTIIMMDPGKARERPREYGGEVETGRLTQDAVEGHNAVIDKLIGIAKRRGREKFYIEGRPVSRDQLIDYLNNRKMEYLELPSGQRAALEKIKKVVLDKAKNAQKDEFVFETHTVVARGTGERVGIQLGGDYVPFEDAFKSLAEAFKVPKGGENDWLVLGHCDIGDTETQRLSKARGGAVAGSEGTRHEFQPATPHIDPEEQLALGRKQLNVHTKERRQPSWLKDKKKWVTGEWAHDFHQHQAGPARPSVP